MKGLRGPCHSTAAGTPRLSLKDGTVVQLLSTIFTCAIPCFQAFHCTRRSFCSFNKTGKDGAINFIIRTFPTLQESFPHATMFILVSALMVSSQRVLCQSLLLVPWFYAIRHVSVRYPGCPRYLERFPSAPRFKYIDSPSVSLS